LATKEQQELANNNGNLQQETQARDKATNKTISNKKDSNKRQQPKIAAKKPQLSPLRPLRPRR
jgi:hypothetical protein